MSCIYLSIFLPSTARARRSYPSSTDAEAPFPSLFLVCHCNSEPVRQTKATCLYFVCSRRFRPETIGQIQPVFLRAICLAEVLPRYEQSHRQNQQQGDACRQLSQCPPSQSKC